MEAEGVAPSKHTRHAAYTTRQGLGKAPHKADAADVVKQACAHAHELHTADLPAGLNILSNLSFFKVQIDTDQHRMHIRHWQCYSQKNSQHATLAGKDRPAGASQNSTSGMVGPMRALRVQQRRHTQAEELKLRCSQISPPRCAQPGCIVPQSRVRDEVTNLPQHAR